MSYQATATEVDISAQIAKLLGSLSPEDIAVSLRANPEAIRKKLRGERPWSRLDMLRIAWLTGRVIRIRPLVDRGQKKSAVGVDLGQ